MGEAGRDGDRFRAGRRRVDAVRADDSLAAARETGRPRGAYVSSVTTTGTWSEGCFQSRASFKIAWDEKAPLSAGEAQT